VFSYLFRTYDSVEFKVGPYLNVIIGPNGTGKALNTINQLTIMGQVWANKHFVKEGPILTCTYNSNSIFPLLQPYLMKSATCCALPNKLSFPPRPIQIAHTIVDFPVPFGPIITFK
jgi:hypothetical protein